MKAALKIINEIVSRGAKSINSRDKIVVVSQWVKYLEIIKMFLELTKDVECVSITGPIRMYQRSVS